MKVQNFTIVMAYYDNHEMLRRHLDEWADYMPFTEEHVQAVIVDDGSPRYPAIDALNEWMDDNNESDPPIEIKLFRVIPNIPWNQDGARNLGMRNVNTIWAFMTDMDHVIPRFEIAKILDMDTAERTYYMPNQLLANGSSLDRPHPNSYLMRVRDFWSMGGYDEDFAGWYGSDGNFRRCAKGAGLIEKTTDVFSTMVFRADDIPDANTKDWGRKGSPYHVANNPDLFWKRHQPPYRAVNPIRFEWVRLR